MYSSNFVRCCQVTAQHLMGLPARPVTRTEPTCQQDGNALLDVLYAMALVMPGLPANALFIAGSCIDSNVLFLCNSWMDIACDSLSRVLEHVICIRGFKGRVLKYPAWGH